MPDLAQLEIQIWSCNQGTQFTYSPVWNLHHEEAEASLVL